jgi:hypothetical protein
LSPSSDSPRKKNRRGANWTRPCDGCFRSYDILRHSINPGREVVEFAGLRQSGYDAAHSHTEDVVRLKPRFLVHLGVGDESVAANVLGPVAPPPFLPQITNSFSIFTLI